MVQNVQAVQPLRFVQNVLNDLNLLNGLNEYYFVIGTGTAGIDIVRNEFSGSSR